MELRRARSLVAYWVNGELVLDDYLNRTDDGEKSGIAVDGAALDILNQFDDWTDPQTVATRFDGYDPESVQEAVDALAAAGLLRTREDAATGTEDRVLGQWEAWGQSATYFHFDTKDTAYISFEESQSDPGVAADRAAVVEQIRASGAAPATFRVNPDAERIMLTRAFLPLDRDFGDVLLSRRTHRHYTGEAVPLRSFSTVLHYAFGPMHFFDAGLLGRLMLRTSPCGGARHESECYVVVRNVESVPPGIYRYSPADHSLEVISRDLDQAHLERLTFGQRMVTEAGFVCFLTLDLRRAMFKYRSARMLRTVLLNTGHLAQTFALCATAVGLGPCQTDAFRDSELEETLGVDGIAETAVYALAAGVPARRVDGHPVADAPDALLSRTLQEPA
ncbi:SagB-type dehydrogenase domain-containing protein [Micromonospora nigra]|uniref:SagB-type dehydrogenase domain-containing protein n=1 Tax=Micromonospora nigra TaxID=145857 RepID=A0A1C6SZL9_9ACTN|nr:SagB/ThcOx family dehydrogenase [Micromonospora nigra]SCL34535.1 SagB-type dehydrogenase domain-containing protein [Micromonospora nigra]